jgi:hypothetical protein
MRTWELRRGYPLISVELRDGKATLTQSPFTISNTNTSSSTTTDDSISADGSDAMGSPPPDSCDSTAALGSWWVPVSFTTGSDRSLRWSSFSSCSAELPSSVGMADADDFLLLNVGRYGFFRANYSTELWERLFRAAPGIAKLSAIDYAGEDMSEHAFGLSAVPGLC